MGNLIEVKLCKNGEYWQLRWTLPDGSKPSKGIGKRKECGGDVSPRKAEKLRQQQEHDLNTGRAMIGKAPTLKAHFDRYMKNRTDITDGTRELYERTGYLLCLHFGEDRKLDRISEHDADDWRGALARGELTEREDPPAEATVCQHVRNAKKIFSAARLPTNPMKHLNGKAPDPDQNWEYISLDDLDTILDACNTDGWRAMFALARLAGLRRDEALRLTWEDVDFENRVLHVVNPEGHRSTKKRNRKVPMSPQLHDLLWAIWMKGEAGENVVAGMPHVKGIWTAAIRVIKRAGLAVYAKPLHTLRKNLETDWLDEYPIHVVTEWLGNSPEIAMKHYTRAEPKHFQQAAGLTAEAVSDEEIRHALQGMKADALVDLIIRLAQASPQTWAECTQSCTQSPPHDS